MSLTETRVVGRPQTLTRSVDILHRIDAVHDEIHHDLLRLYRVCHHLARFGSRSVRIENGVPVRFGTQQGNDLANDFIHIDQLPVRFALSRYRADGALMTT